VKKVAVILPTFYKGGVLKGLKNTAKMIRHASTQMGEPLEVVIAVPKGAYNLVSEFAEEIASGIEIREIWPRLLGPDATERALRWGGETKSTIPELTVHYRDGVSDLLDCDLWFVITNRTVDEHGLVRPVLPIRPVVMIPYDFIEQYIPEVLPANFRAAVAESTRSADLVLVTQPQTARDAVSFIGCAEERVFQVPFEFEIPSTLKSLHGKASPTLRLPLDNQLRFVWPTNSSVHKNHSTVFHGLRLAMDRGARLTGEMTGLSTEAYAEDRESTANRFGGVFMKMWDDFQELGMSDVIHPNGYLPESNFAGLLRGADFAIHSSKYDNGAYALVEAAFLGIPSICSDYPQLRFLAESLEIPAVWFAPDDPDDFAQAIEDISNHGREIVASLPSRESLQAHGWESTAVNWWSNVRAKLREVLNDE
jgi:glycosyltransferase involved in cell wall biosynthesis